MPKVPTASGTALRRNQACKACRRRKLKCDASRPHCGNCYKTWKGATSVPPPEGYEHPSAPQCSYDPVEGLTLAETVNPVERIRHLESQVAELRKRLQDATGSSPASSDRPLTATTDTSTRLTPLAAPSLSPPSQTQSEAPFGINGSNGHTPSPPANGHDGSYGTATPPSALTSRALTPNDDPNGKTPFLDLLFRGWNCDLPDQEKLLHYCEVFFNCDPCASRILHRGSFFASLYLNPTDPRFPHSALLHAICASASRWIDSGAFKGDIRRDTFAEYHAGKTRQYIDRTMASGADIFQVLQACIILSWYFYAEGRWVEVWIFAAFQTRVAIPLRLNYPRTFTEQGIASPGAYLSPPTDNQDLEMRRRAWWMAVMFDRIVSVGGWLHSIEYKHIGTELPLRREDFENNFVDRHNPQHLHDPKFFTDHPVEFTDSWMLLIKTIMLFGKVTDLNTELQLTQSRAQGKAFNPLSSSKFMELESLVAEGFLKSIPAPYSSYLDEMVQNPQNVAHDPDLYLVHLVPHAATITLHNPYIDFNNPEALSTKRCLEASDAILRAYYAYLRVCSDGVNFSVTFYALHPFVTICWYLSAVVQIQVCKRMIEIGNPAEEAAVWEKINILRMAMMQYGKLSPIGVRQEKLLRTLMEEIVRITKTVSPLEVGCVPLYPFSHQGAFSSDGISAVPGAPLPLVQPEIFQYSPSSQMGMVAGSNWDHQAESSLSPLSHASSSQSSRLDHTYHS